MSVLATLGIGAGDVEVRALLIDPPDDVLAEAGGLRPRPTVASSVMVAEPSLQLVWWPEGEEDLGEASLNRLGWMLGATGGAGEAWVVVEGEGPGLKGPGLEAVTAAGMVAGEARAVEEADEGAVALWVTSPEQHAG